MKPVNRGNTAPGEASGRWRRVARRARGCGAAGGGAAAAAGADGRRPAGRAAGAVPGPGGGAAADRRGLDARRPGPGGPGAGAGGRAGRAPGLRQERARGAGGNARNGSIAKTVQTGVGPVPLQVPRDRAGTFEPLLVPKRAGRVAGGLDDMVISLYAHGMSVRDIMHHLEQVYGTQLSHETVSRITDAVLEEARAWQSRPLDPVYAAVFLDAIVVKVRDDQVVQNKPAYVAIGVDADGEKHVLGIWLAKTPPQAAAAGEGARFWGSVMADLQEPRRPRHPHRLRRRARRVRGRDHRRVPARGRPALRCPSDTERLRPVARRDAGEVAKELRKIYTAPAAEAAFDALAAFDAPPGGGSTRRPPGSGRTPGRTSPRSWPSPRPSASCSTPPTASRPELPAPQGHQGPRPLPDRRRRRQAALARHHQHRGQKSPRARRPPPGDRQAVRPARPHGGGPARHRMARGPHRARHRLPGSHTLERSLNNIIQKHLHT